MKKIIGIIIVFLAVIILAAFLFDWGRHDAQMPAPAQSATTTSEMPVISYPLDGDTVTSPIQVSGTVVGNWFFEGSFPVELIDSDGDVIATTTAATSGDWATTSMVDFSATLTYPKATTTERALIMLKNDNPSGDPENDKERFIQVILK